MRPGVDVWNLACATGPVFARFISDASSTVKLILKKDHGTVDCAVQFVWWPRPAVCIEMAASSVLIAVIAGLADAVPVCG